MRPSIMSRSMITLATLAITSGALTATSATAAAPAGVTRGEVLAAATAIRADTGNPFEYSPATQHTLRVLALKVCDVDARIGQSLMAIFASPIESRDNVDGLATWAIVYTPGIGLDDPPLLQGCSFGSLATTSAGDVMSGTSTLAGSRTISSRLSGNVFTTPPMIDETAGPDEEDAPLPAFSAEGDSVRSTTTTTSTKVVTPKTAKQKKAAKKIYLKKFMSIKKAYAKALEKAGSNRSERSKARKVYDKKFRAAKKAYRAAVAKTSKVVKNSKTTVKKSPFDVSASAEVPTHPPV